uniref:Methyl-CpG-binding domain-containing protein 8 n=1 Tax=Arundo donax TaxID=35708 RepID=A0A0A9GM04_ARUDO
MVRSGVTVPKGASNSNDQPDGTNGFAEVNVFNDQVGSDHVSRPTTLRNANRYENQIIDHGMTAPKHGEINNTAKARDVNLNSSLDTVSFPIASAHNETSLVHNESNRSSVTVKCISGSFNNNDCASSVSSCSGSTNKIPSSCKVNKTSTAASRCFSPSYGNNNDAVKANIFGITNNTVVHQSDLGTPLTPMATKADCFAFRSMQSKNSDKERASDPKERTDDMTNRTSYEAGFGEAYNNDILTGGVTERGFAQFSNSFTRIKPNASSHSSRPEYNTPTTSNFKGSDFNCMMKGSSVSGGDMNSVKGSFVNRPISNNEPNIPMHEVIGKSNNEMQNIYNNYASGCDHLAASRTSRNVNGVMSMQANFGSMSSVVRSVGDVPMSSTTQDQCDLHLGFGAHNQQIFSSQGEVRSAAGSPQLGSIAKNNSSPTRSSQFGSMARPKSFPTGSPQFGSFARPNFVPAASSPFGSVARPGSVPPAGSSHFGSMAQPNSVPPATSSQFGCTARPNSVAPAQSAQFGSMAQPNSAPPVKSQFGSMPGPNSVTPAVSSQFANMPSQNFVSTPEPTLVLGYAQQMGNGPPAQLGWDLSLSRMANGGGGMLTCVCIWCNSQFHHFGPVDGPQAGTFAFICPACKDRMSARNMPNNGSWQP